VEDLDSKRLNVLHFQVHLKYDFDSGMSGHKAVNQKTQGKTWDRSQVKA
jgi:hypothetical protein